MPGVLVNSQYIYVNSFNRYPTDKTYDFTIDIPDGMITCQDTEYLSIVVSSFTMVKNWYYINTTNNLLRIVIPHENVTVDIYVEPGNYSFRKLATNITNQMALHNIVGSCMYNSSLNKYLIEIPQGSYIDFTPTNSLWYVLGFNQTYVYMPQNDTVILSNNVVKQFLSDTMNIYVENVTPDKNVSAIENDTNNKCTPSTCILTLANNIGFFDSWDFVNQDNWFRLNVKEKRITRLRLSVRNEFKEIMPYITDYNIAIKVETYSNDQSMANKTLLTLESIEDYLRLSFVSNNIHKIQ